MKFGAIAIGRNEGERLRRCLKSLSSATAIVYVDFGFDRWICAVGARRRRRGD